MPPPGIKYTFTRLIPQLFVPFLSYLTLTIAQSRGFIKIPPWLFISIVVLSKPVSFFAQSLYTKWVNERRALERGAKLPPVVQESMLGMMAVVRDDVTNGYPGDIIQRWSAVYGNIFQLDFPTACLADYLDDICSESPNLQVVTTEPEHIKAILTAQFEHFDKGYLLSSVLSSLFGTGVFNADGETWKFHRAIARPFFTRERISDFNIYERNSLLALTLAKERIAEGFSVDFQDLIARFTLDSASQFLFGHNINSLSAGTPYPPSLTHKGPPSSSTHPSPATTYSTIFSQSQTATLLRFALGPDWPLLEFFGDKIAPMRDVMDEVTGPIMWDAMGKREAKLKKSNSEKEEEEEEGTLLDYLVKQTQDPKIILDELMNLLVAGRDTTAALLTFSLYMLTKHPEIEQRLRSEIIDKVGINGRPDYDNMREMRYMRAFINEVLRLYPPGPINSRTTNKATVIPAARTGEMPIYIPANVTVAWGVHAMHRRTDLWGPDALVFDPDRFLDERLQKYLIPNPFIFLPFNAGPRICIGQQFAYHQATYFLVRLLQQFTSFSLDKAANVQPPKEWASGGGLKATECIRPQAHLTMYVKGGLWVNMKELVQRGAPV